MRRLPFSFVAFLALAAPAILAAGPIVIDFEGLPDSTIITNQYLGVTFSNAIILTAGISLNEFEFPPFSGSNVASDNGGPLSIAFASPATTFAGYFTHTVPLTLRAFNLANTQVALIPSLFSDNLALSGDLGSHPNEFLQLSFAGGFSRVTITGDSAGGAFVLDDAALTSAVPEPSPLSLAFVGVAFLLGVRRVFVRGSRAWKLSR